MNRLAQYKADKTYRAKQNLLAHIHQAIAPELAAMRHADDLLERVTRKHNGITEKRGAMTSQEQSKYYGAMLCTMGHMRGSESLVPSDSFEACALAGMDKAEQVTRNIADNNI